MKYSGIEWIGDIPDSWNLIRLKDWCLSKKEIAGEKYVNYERLALTLNGVVKRAKDDSEGLQPKEFATYQILRENDFIFKMIDLQNISTSRVGLSPYTGLVSPAYIRFTSRHEGQFNDFIYYYLMSLYYNCVFNSLGGDGVRSSLNATDMGNLQIPLPKVDLQKKIVAAIKEKSAGIDALIEIETQQIEKLKEYKQAIITEAVTKGLDKNAPMKDSGVEWIGNIPIKWSLPSIKMIADTCSGGTPKSGNSEFFDGDINWVCSYDLKGDVIEESKMKITEKGASMIAGKMQKPGSILIAMYGGGGTIGNSGRLNCYARTNQAICSIDFNRALILPEYAHYVVRFMRPFWMIYAVGTRKDPNINQVIVENMPFICPTIDEQRKITDYLDEKCAKIEKILIIKQQKIEKLNEYKKSLIYEYVTGKKEVF